MSFLSPKLKVKVNLEEDAFVVIIEMLTLAKSGKPYRHLLTTIKDRAEQFPRVAMLIQGLAENLQDGLPRNRRP